MASLFCQAHEAELIGPLYNWILVPVDYSHRQLVPMQDLVPGDRVITIEVDPEKLAAINYNETFLVCYITFSWLHW